MSSTSDLPRLNRRAFVAGAAVCCAPALAQHSGHGAALPEAAPAARDHVGAVACNGTIHIIGGRFNTFEYNTDLHHVYLPSLDTWKERAPLPTARSGLGLVIYRDRLFAMGGEYGVQDTGQISQGAVFGQMES